MELIEHSKPIVEDKEFTDDVRRENLSQHIIRRVFAVKKTFLNVSFKQSDIDNCYFRNCTFIRCDFTGAQIKNSNFRGSQYEDCKFQYSTWEHTHLDEKFLDNCIPSEENLAQDLVRSLRVNFGHIGNYSAVNKAASLEVALTGQHLFNAAYSKKSYYRSKYKGWDRVLHAARHACWKALDLLWGNGESMLRIIICGIVTVIVWAVFLPLGHHKFDWPNSLGLVTQTFWGVSTVPPLPNCHIVMLTAFRFIFFGLFMAVLIKRLTRR